MYADGRQEADIQCVLSSLSSIFPASSDLDVAVAVTPAIFVQEVMYPASGFHESAGIEKVNNNKT
jgi:hypothetical protein